MTSPEADAQMNRLNKYWQKQEFDKWYDSECAGAETMRDLCYLAWQAAIQSREPRGIPMGEFRRIFAAPTTDEGRAEARALTEALEFGSVLKSDDEQAALSTQNPEKVEGDMVTVCCGRRECGGECGNDWQGMKRAPSAGVVPEGKLWSFLRSVIGQGADIHQDYIAGRHANYEAYSARLDTAAIERQEQLRAMLASAPPPPTQPASSAGVEG